MTHFTSTTHIIPLQVTSPHPPISPKQPILPPTTNFIPTTHSLPNETFNHQRPISPSTAHFTQTPNPPTYFTPTPYRKMTHITITAHFNSNYPFHPNDLFHPNVSLYTKDPISIPTVN